MNSFSSLVRVGNNAELKTIGESQTQVCNVRLAVSTGRGDRRGTMWLDGKILGSRGAALAGRLTKGIAERVARVSAMRQESSNASTREFTGYGHRFVERRGPPGFGHAILVPSVTSERRPYLPVERVGADVISSNLNQVLYDAPDWCIALIASRLHLVWIATVCGRLESSFRYSNTLGWNTFPVPNFTDAQKEQLSASARRILKTRYTHYPKTIAELYDPDDMPDDLRAAHKANDDLLETMYIGRPFRNDSERLEKMFAMYVKRVGSGPKKKSLAA